MEDAGINGQDSGEIAAVDATAKLDAAANERGPGASCNGPSGSDNTFLSFDHPVVSTAALLGSNW